MDANGEPSIRTALATAWRAHLAALLAHRAGALSGNDHEDLHQFRVALRKTRALIKLFRHVLPDVQHFRDEFKQLAGATNDARDLDVLVEQVQGRIAAAPDQLENAAPLVTELKRQRAAAQASLRKAIDSPRATILVDQWRDWLDALPASTVQPPLADVAAWTVIRPLIIEHSRRLLQAGVSIDAHAPATALHELRIRGKGLRYLLESFDLGARQQRIERLHEKLKDFQTLLGAHQDSIVAAAHWQQLATLQGQRENRTTGDGPAAGEDRSAATRSLLRQWLAAETARQREIRAELPAALKKLAKSCDDL